MLSQLLTFGNSSQAISVADVQATGAVNLSTIAAFQATHVRIIPLSINGSGAMGVELYTPCAYAEYFAWQAGRGYTNGGYVGIDSTTWSVRTGFGALLTGTSYNALATRSGLLIRVLPATGLTWVSPQLDLTSYFW